MTEELRNFVVFILNEETEKSLLKPLEGGGGGVWNLENTCQAWQEKW